MTENQESKKEGHMIKPILIVLAILIVVRIVLTLYYNSSYYEKRMMEIREEPLFGDYHAELKELGLSSFADLEALVKPLIKKTTRLIVKKPSQAPENSQLKSHFGGQPYFENSEEWPKSKSGRPLDFIFQVFNTGDMQLPEHIKLVQFYYDFKEFPWETAKDGWLVKIYENLKKDEIKAIPKPQELEKSKYCEIDFLESKSLPDWEGINRISDKASKLSCLLNEDEPWDTYDEISEKLTGKVDYQSQLGGYPIWVQGESTPKDAHGNPMEMLLQIDSEPNPELMWGDDGMVYFFYDPKSKQIEFTLQCY